MSKTFLDFEIEEVYELIAICTNMPDYRLAWNLNRLLDINLVKVDDVVSTNSSRTHIGGLYDSFDQDPVTRYSKYQYIEDEELYMHLISNKSRGNILFKELAQFDFILKVDSLDDYQQDYLNQLKSAKLFTLVQSLDTDSVNNEYLTML